MVLRFYRCFGTGAKMLECLGRFLPCCQKGLYTCLYLLLQAHPQQKHQTSSRRETLKKSLRELLSSSH